MPRVLVTTPLKQLSNEFVNKFISLAILAKTMKSPLAFGSAFLQLKNRV